MKLLLDTNILLDVLMDREPFYELSQRIWNSCADKEFTGCISSLSFANMVYHMRKTLTPEKIERLADRMSNIFNFVDLTVLDITQAAQMRWNDFEDALQSAAAERVKADYIITRNVKDFEQSNIKALTPEDFLDLNYK